MKKLSILFAVLFSIAFSVVSMKPYTKETIPPLCDTIPVLSHDTVIPPVTGEFRKISEDKFIVNAPVPMELYIPGNLSIEDIIIDPTVYIRFPDGEMYNKKELHPSIVIKEMNDSIINELRNGDKILDRLSFKSSEDDILLFWLQLRRGLNR